MLVRGPFTIETAETTCRWYFRAGFLGLPWLWGALYIFFSHYQHESDVIRWYVAHAKLYGLWAASLFVAATVALVFCLPASSSLWVIAPFQDTFQWGIFAANMSANASGDGDTGSSSSSSSGGAGLLF